MSAFFPVVPNISGVPPVLRTALRAINAVTLLIADAQFFTRQKPFWGILDSQGSPLIRPDNFIEVGVQSTTNLPTYPIENGGFRNFNKVILPGVIRIQVSKGGNTRVRREFMVSVVSLTKSRQLVTIAIPEGWQRNAYNLERADLLRTHEEGVTLITYDLYFKRVEIVPVQAFQSTTAASGASPADGGTAQAIPGSSSPSVVADIARQTTSFGSNVLGVAQQMITYGGPLLTIGTLLAYSGGNILSVLASPLTLATLTSVGLPFVLQNAGWAITSIGGLLEDGIGAVASLGSSSTISNLLPQLGSLSETSGQLSQTLLNSATTLQTGGTLASYSFSGPGIPVAQAGSSAAQVLDGTAGPVRIGNTTFGPIMPSRVQ